MSPEPRYVCSSRAEEFQRRSVQPSPVQLADTTYDYLKELMVTMNDSPPSFHELTEGPQLLCKPLPLTPSGLTCVRTFLRQKSELNSLMISTEDCPAMALAESISVGVRRGSIDANGGKHSVLIAAHMLVTGITVDVLEFMDINCRNCDNNTVEPCHEIAAAKQPDAQLFMWSVMMFKV